MEELKRCESNHQLGNKRAEMIDFGCGALLHDGSCTVGAADRALACCSASSGPAVRVLFPGLRVSILGL